MSDSPLPSIIIFVVFGAMVLGVLVVLVLSIYERILPIIERRSGGVSLRERLSIRFAALRRRHRREAEDEGDDLDDDTAALMSMLSVASVVVDEHDEVVRANPGAYRLGVVVDDALVEPTVLNVVHEVRATGGRRSFDLETSTPERFIEREGAVFDGSPAGDSGVTRPNWLKVTVGRIDERFVVVLLDDVSDAIRFSQVRDSFIVNVSEQLLKPTEALERLSAELERADLDPARLRRDAHEVRVTSGHLNHLVSDLLLLIKAQEPVTPSTANRFNVMEQLRAVVATLEPVGDAHGVRVQAAGDDGLVSNGEPEQIRAAVTKLVENAIAYSPRGATVSVSAAQASDGEHAVIRVIDQGVGIAKAEQSRIFERFYRGTDQSDRSMDGVGLGLAIVKHVALTHHGTVGVWSAPGEGSTFTLTLPLAQ